MISRIWHGWTTPENANAYEKLLRHEIIEGFIDRKIDGFRRMHILRRILGEEVEFTNIMWFDSIDSFESSLEKTMKHQLSLQKQEHYARAGNTFMVTFH